MKKYNSGCMPGRGFSYQKFEGHLGRIHESLVPLRNSRIIADNKNYLEALKVLEDLASKYGVQSPTIALKTPRVKLTGKPMTTFRTMMGLDVIWRDFEIGDKPGSEDYQNLQRLGRIILEAFSRYGVVETENNDDGLSLKEWDKKKSNKTLAEIVMTECTKNG